MKTCFAVLASLLLSINLFGTVHVTTVNDYGSPGAPLQYDIDLDGDDDFSFTEQTYAAYVTCLKASSEYASESDPTYYFPKAYTEGAALGTFVWVSNVPPSSSSWGKLTNTGGNFNNTVKYLMVKFQNTSGDTFYGWFEIDCTSSAGSNERDIKIISYAYNDVPDQPLNAGQTTEPAGIGVSLLSDLNVTFSKGAVSFNGLGNEVDRITMTSIDGRQSIIDAPLSGRAYAVKTSGHVVVISYFREEELLASAKYFVR